METPNKGKKGTTEYMTSLLAFMDHSSSLLVSLGFCKGVNSYLTYLSQQGRKAEKSGGMEFRRALTN